MLLALILSIVLYDAVSAAPQGTYIGCYVDKPIRDLPKIAYSNDWALTTARCTSQCLKLGYKYAATQFSSWCFCGNEYGKYGKQPSNNKCFLDCQGDRSQKCGGVWANSVYHTGWKKSFGPTTTCIAWGDPHFRTLDGAAYDFMGTCTYELSGTCKKTDLPQYSVRIKQEFRGGPGPSYAKVIQVRYNGHVINMRRHNVLEVDGLRENPPVTNLKGITVTFDGRYLTVELDNGVIAKYDGNYDPKVMIPSAYKGVICGLCGNFDGNPGNDRRDDNYQIAQDIDNEDGCSVDPGPGPECPASDKNMAGGKHNCGPIMDPNSVFFPCANTLGTVIKELFNACVMDVCAAEPGKMKDVGCVTMSALADLCGTVGHAIPNWREAVDCQIKCDANMEYKPLVSSCPRTCAAPKAHETCDLPKVEGCQCKAGFIMSGTKCVRETQCGCVDAEGNYRKKGESWVSDDCSTVFTCNSFTDISKKTQKCHANAECTVNNGLRECTCKKGFEGDGINKCDAPKKWQEVTGTFIAMHNAKEIKGITVEQCKAACEQEKTFKCVSVDYNVKNPRCYLSKMSVGEAKKNNLIRKDPNFTLFVMG